MCICERNAGRQETHESSVRRSSDSSGREQTKPGWHFSPANSSSCCAPRCQRVFRQGPCIAAECTASAVIIRQASTHAHLAGDARPLGQPLGDDGVHEEAAGGVESGVVLVVIVIDVAINAACRPRGCLNNKCSTGIRPRTWGRLREHQS